MVLRWQLFIFIFLVLIGLVRLYLANTKPQTIFGQVIITTTLEQEPRRSTSSQIFHSGQISVIAKPYPELHFGDRVKIEGELLAGNVVKYPKIAVIANNRSKLVWQSYLFKLRNQFAEIFYQSLPEPQASTVAGMVLGIDQIPADFKNDLRRSGLIHLVVVSGQNITLLAGFMISLAGIVKRRIAILLSLLAIVVYTLLTGAQPPTIRAALMAAFAYIGQYFGRQTFGLLMLFWATTLMFAWEPNLILNLSFILSFSATLGILLFEPYFKVFLKRPRLLVESIGVTVSAWLATLPVLIISFGQASIVAVFANVLVTVVILPIMILGFVMAGLGIALPFLGQIIGWFVYLPLTYLIFIAKTFSGLPFATVKIERPLPVVIVGYYLLLIVMFLWLRNRYSKKLS